MKNMSKSKLYLAITLNLLIVTAEILSGLFANSMSLVADALHNFGDVISLIIALIALVFSKKKPTREMTYGFIRSEMMAGFVNSLFLLFSMIFIVYGSAVRLFHPGDVNGTAMIVVAAIALGANIFSAMLVRDAGNPHGHDHSHSHGAEDEDMNMKAVYIHLVSDAGISLGVILGGVLILLFKIPLIDPIFSILFTLFILYECVKMIRVTFLSLMDAAGKNLDEIEKKILSHHDVLSLHDVHLSKPSSRDVYFTAHLVLKDGTSLKRIEELFESLRGELRAYGVTHPLFQPETEKYHNDERACQPHCGPESGVENR
jgi:cobalt-zinc-cadmium efflux system protein